MQKCPRAKVSHRAKVSPRSKVSPRAKVTPTRSKLYVIASIVLLLCFKKPSIENQILIFFIFILIYINGMYYIISRYIEMNYLCSISKLDTTLLLKLV